MNNIDGLLNSNISPVRDLNDTLQLGDCHEWWVVFVMDSNFVFGVG